MIFSTLVRLFSAAAFLLVFTACNNKEAEKGNKTDVKKDSAKPSVKNDSAAVKPPIINIMDTISPARVVLCMKDSSASYEGVGPKLRAIYGAKLGEVLKKNKISMAGPPMAWYKTDKPPFFFDAGVPVNKIPSKLPAGVFVKELKADSALVAHFYGPYNLLSNGYKAIKDWAKDNKIKIGNAPFEIYVGDPMEKDGNMKDPYKVQTDIVFTRN